MTPPLASVVIAAYRSNLDYLQEAISSALAQELREIEVIVTDDSRQEQIRFLVESFGDSRVRYRSNASPLGVARNHAAAFQEARAPFLATLNHDDRWNPRFLSTLVPPMENNASLVASFCDHYLIDASGKVLLEETDLASAKWGRASLAPGAHSSMVPLVAARTVPLAVGCVFRKSALPAGEPRHESGPAYDFWITYLLAKSGRGAYYSPERLSSWRTHGGSITTNGSLSWALGASFCWAAILEDEIFRDFHEISRPMAALALRDAAVRSLRAGLGWQAYKLASQSHRLRRAKAAV